jgi:type 2 lantibiotic biosynthesis protein LanM
MSPSRRGGRVPNVSLPIPPREAEPRMTSCWWAPGLALTERLPAPSRLDASREERARRRLIRWRTSSGLAAGDGLTTRLARAGLTESDLLALLAEPPEALGARTVRPRWAAVVERAVAAAPRSPHPVKAGADLSLAAFTVPLKPFVDDAVKRIHDRVTVQATTTQIDLSAVTEGFAEHLARRLVRRAARTLVLELNVARVAGQLAGDTAQDRFADFASQLATSPALAALFEEYPVLARLLGQACENAVDSLLELLGRFDADRADIVKELLGGVDPGVLTAVELDGGDLHQGGRAVAILRFAGGEKVVYKPRCQRMQTYFAELVSWLNGNVPGLDLRAPAALARDGYGWVEFVAHRPCTDITEIDRFYRRQGALLALLYAVDATDVHYENLIAAGDQPVLVDVETLFHPTLSAAMTAGSDPAATALQASVVRTTLLPTLVIGENGALDVSGLGGDKDTTFPFDGVAWDSTGTDEMRLVRRPAVFPGASNRPRLGERDADPKAYQAALLTGFRLAYDAIVANRADLTDPGGMLERYADSEIRVVVRPSQTYATLLDESTHPDLLREGLDRDGLFDVLWVDATHDELLRRLTPYEIADLWAGDVPLFTGRPRSRGVWTASGDHEPTLFERPSLVTVTSKAAAMAEVDRLDQEWLITATLAIRDQTAVHRSGDVPAEAITAAVPDSPRLLTAACGIADEIIARSLHDEHRANWVGVEAIDGQHWAVVPMGAGLADGYTGVALFLAQLGKLTGSARYTDLARKALRPIPRLLDVLTADTELGRAIGPGGFLGLGGIGYALARLSTLLDDAEISSWLSAAVEATGKTDGEQTGMMAGRAGGLAAMLAVHAETGLPAARELAGRFADRLLSGATEPVDEVLPATGFASGPAGIAYAMLRYATTVATVPGRYAAAARAILGRDGAAALGGDANYSWCTGISGALLARVDLLGAQGDSSSTIDRYVSALADRTPLRDISLCHGELGVVEALTVLAGRGHDLASTVRAHSAARVLGALDRYGPRCGTPDGVLSPGLLTGLSGIGYGLLRLGFAEQVPSVLLLEPTKSLANPHI